MMALTPLLFIGHGSPMNIIQENDYTKGLKELGKTLPKPKAILVISAHWLTRGTYITCNDHPRQIYDFYGFPDELFKVIYQPKGIPELAKKIVKNTGWIKIRCASDWGLDHASWAVLKHIYPDADIPVMELSLDYSQPPQYHYRFAPILSFLRQEEVLIIGSGNIVHNIKLADFDNLDAKPFEWATSFDEKVKELLLSGNHEKLEGYEKQIDFAHQALPTNEHFLPLLYIAGLQQPGEKVNFIYEGFQNGSVSMRSFIIS
jgi:4,5-DOPA dioxygenase extradiol